MSCDILWQTVTDVNFELSFPQYYVRLVCSLIFFKLYFVMCYYMFDEIKLYIFTYLCAVIMPPSGSTSRRRHNVLVSSVRSSVCYKLVFNKSLLKSS